MSEYYTIEPAWSGERAFVIGGGPSLKGFNPVVLKGHGKVIATNTAALDLVPDADAMFAADGRWFEWNKDRLHLNRSPLRFCRQVPRDGVAPWSLLRLRHDRSHVMTYEADTVFGFCSGAMATCIAYHMGAREVVWLGFDMRPGNYHASHKHETPPRFYEQDFMPGLDIVRKGLAAKGVAVINATVGSAYSGAPQLALDDLLQGGIGVCLGDQTS